MRSLFLRLLVGLWATMALLSALFALIHAATFPDEAREGWRRVVLRSMTLRSQEAIACGARGEPVARCEEILAPIEERDQRLAVYRDGRAIAGRAIEGGAELAQAALVAEGGVASENVGDTEHLALVLDGGDGAVAVGEQRRPSRWMFFLVPETLPYRLLAIVVVTGAISVLLARYLSRHLRTLREAATRLGAGDFSVRVSSQLTGADSEALALGEELDRMSERIQALLETQRRLLRDVSHELRSPLARLAIALELARRKSPVEAHAALGRIEREADRLNEMIAELLTLSRLESGVDGHGAEPVDLSETTRELLADVAFEAEQRGVRIDSELAPALTLDGHAELLRRAVENVVRNAVRFSPDDGVVVVRLRPHEGMLELSVRDHGPGVPAASLSRLFEPFYRVGDDRARHNGGSGIGLAITQGAVALHGGSVRAENAEGGGLRVTLRLPSSGRGDPRPPLLGG